MHQIKNNVKFCTLIKTRWPKLLHYNDSNLIQDQSPSPPVIILKDMLGAVAMVHVPVEDENTQGIVGNALSVAGGQSSRVEEAEAAGSVFLCVMPRGTYNSHPVPHLHTNTNHEKQSNHFQY